MNNKISLVGDSFNPNRIQQHQNDNQVENKRIWTTEKVNKYIELMNRGREDTKNSPFFEGNFGWRDGNILFEYTQDEWDEFIRCSKDIEYFAENYCQIKTEEQFTNFELYDYQKDFFGAVLNDRKVIYLASRQIGKCITPDTTIDIKIDNNIIPNIKLIDLYNKIYPNQNKGILDKIKNFLWVIYSKL